MSEETVSDEQPEHSGLVDERILAKVEKEKETNPYAGIITGADDVFVRFIQALKDERGMHIETYITVLAALTGFACQMAIRREIIEKNNLDPETVFISGKAEDGKRYFFGDMLNKPLAESPLSVWNIVASGVQQAGGELPDLFDIFSHSSKTVGTDQFGVPRVPEKHASTADTPQGYIENLWHGTEALLSDYCDSPLEWPILLATTMQKAIINGKTVIPPTVAGVIAMEVAVAMSKVDPEEFGIEV